MGGPLIKNEVCAWAKKANMKVLVFKLDFDRTFESIIWGYLDSVLDQIGFRYRYHRWIRVCLFSSSASFVVNGCPIDEFNVFNGVRQGDPMSPFLFIEAMDGLNVAIKAAKEKCIFKGVKILTVKPIYHIFFMRTMPFYG